MTGIPANDDQKEKCNHKTRIFTHTKFFCKGCGIELPEEKCTRHEWEAIGDLHFPEITQDYCKKCNVSKAEYDSYQKGFNEGIDTSLRQALKLSKNTQTDCEDCGKSSCGRVGHNIVKKLMIDYIELKSSLENLKTTQNGSG